MRLPPAPERVSEASLVRLLLPRSPSLQIAFRFAGIDHPPLRVRAIHGRAAHQVHDEAQRLPEERRADHARAAIVALSLTDHLGAQVFRIEDVEQLPIHDFAALSDACWAALSTVGPMLRYVDLNAWNDALCRGLRDPSNQMTAYALGQACDATFSRIVDRPDRFWGLPTGELLDGHWLLHRAARLIWEERFGKK